MAGYQDSRRDKAVSALGVALLHAVLGYLLVTGLGFDPVRHASETLAAFDVTEPLPPPEEEAPQPERAAAREEGAAAPPALEARPSLVVAPPLVVPVPSPVIAAPVASRNSAPTSGAAPVAGPGTGGGGLGVGTGSGGAGDGPGGGGAVRARQIAGAITPRDYPDGARRAGATGAVTVRFTVGADGRARGCAVAISSGRSDLDATTCRLIEGRFRYRAARDAAGRAVAEERAWRQTWWFE